MKGKEERLTVTVREAAKRVGISHVSLYNAIERGEFPAIRIGRRLVVPIVALERYLENAGQPAGSKA